VLPTANNPVQIGVLSVQPASCHLRHQAYLSSAQIEVAHIWNKLLIFKEAGIFPVLLEASHQIVFQTGRIRSWSVHTSRTKHNLALSRTRSSSARCLLWASHRCRGRSRALRSTSQRSQHSRRLSTRRKQRLSPFPLCTTRNSCELRRAPPSCNMLSKRRAPPMKLNSVVLLLLGPVRNLTPTASNK
jgi:hypothetical protein